jgi:SAM-dependent methyltransferase
MSTHQITLVPPPAVRVVEPLTPQDEVLRRMSEARNYNAWLLDRARPHLGRRVLDVGAGIGTFTEELARVADEVVAVEPEAADLEQLRARFARNSKVTVVDLAAGALVRSFLGDPFDAAYCSNVLEHIADDVGAMRGVHAQLRPGGKLLALVPAHPVLYGATDRLVFHERRYTKDTLGKHLREAGFRVDELRYVNPLGALGWLVSSRILQREQIPEGPLKLYDKLVPVLRAIDRLPLPFGLSLWAVATRPNTTGAASASAANA